jgi:hypothetical protein
MSLNQSTQLPMANANSLCSALTSYTGGQLLTPIVTGFYGYVSGAQSFDIPYTGSTNGLCTLVVGDKNFGGSNVNNVEISIAVDNPTLVVQGKTIRAAQAKGAGK